ncbi:MAG: response regulator [Nitrospira sp.]
MEPNHPGNNNWLMHHATKIAIGLVTVLMLFMPVIFWRQNEANEKARSWVVHTYEVIGHIELLFGKLKDVQSGQRGFLLTDNDIYLEAYNKALKDADEGVGTGQLLPSGKLEGDQSTSGARSFQHRSIRQELAFLRNLTSDNPVQQSNLGELDEVVNILLEYLATTIQARKAHTEVKLDLLRGKATMDQIRSLMRIMEAEETHLLTLRMEVADNNAQQSNRMTFITMLAFYVVIILAIWLYQRSREHAQIEMVRYTRELERTGEELKTQQEELQAANEELEVTNEEMEEKAKALEEQNAQIQQQSEELTESQRLIEAKSKEVERASKYKSEFLANMSHELRTPLNSLLILSRILAANEPGNLTEDQVEEARVIHKGGLELLGLINDILDLSKVEAGKLTLSLETVAFQDIAMHMQEQFAPVAKEKGLAFPIKVAEGLPPTIYTDVQRVEQILKNLLSNAFKFTEQGSVTLEIHQPHKRDVRRTDHHAIAFSVIDTGIGIDPSKFKDIFEAFQQEDGSVDRHYGGTGLGLTIARKFAHMLGGEVSVRSVKGEGSIFTLILPQKLSPAQTADIQAPVETVQIEEPRIELKSIPQTVIPDFIPDDRRDIGERDKVLLIIEDDPNFATVLMKIARKRGYKCVAAGDGKTGLVLAVEQPVTAILLDLALPDFDGMRVLDQLKHDLRTRHIPVHILSGRKETIVPLQKGAIGYLTKPANQEAIEGVFTKVEDLLRTELKQVLVVEDDQKTQLAIQSLLKKEKLQITLADTGAAGLKQIREKTFDCVILDLQLPDMTGITFLETLEHASGQTAPPVIIYTARTLSEEENRTLSRYTGSIVMKGAHSPERLLDEVTLFLHSVESTLSKEQQDMIRMQHNPDTALQGRTLLLVDDDLRNTFALSKLLKKHGMHTVIADNGHMALEKLKEFSTIELILMDLMMPVMDGYQAMQAIRAHPSFGSIPILALTARAMPEEQTKCLAAGANDYLTKPVDSERLLTLLRVWLFQQDLAA